jgi:alkanesulfonate monooxygenase SsuD/methylene tetrahydromethanopterin reductase-like flavin-dependent oxidoreductase (luciferase family)
VTDTPTGPLRIGLFDIMQVDPLGDGDVASMYANRLDDLAFAEETGFEAAFVAERHFLPQFAAASATAWIAAASQRTSRMRLGALGYTLPIKAPVQLAEDIATLDLLTNGRLEVGFGTGHRVEELIALGQDPLLRNTIFQERYALLRGLLSGGQATYERGEVRVHQVVIAPLPKQVPHPPLWFAGTDPTAARWIATNGLGLAIGFKPTAELEPAVAAFREGLTESPDGGIHRPLGHLALMRSVIVGDTDDVVRREIIDDLLRLGELAGQGTEANRPDRHRDANNQVDTMIASDIMIAGSVETVAAGIRRQRDRLGFDTFLASVYAMGASQERVRRSMRLLAGPVRQCMAEQAAG